jgi:hypothetical protein
MVVASQRYADLTRSDPLLSDRTSDSDAAAAASNPAQRQVSFATGSGRAAPPTPWFVEPLPAHNKLMSPYFHPRYIQREAERPSPAAWERLAAPVRRTPAPLPPQPAPTPVRAQPVAARAMPVPRSVSAGHAVGTAPPREARVAAAPTYGVRRFDIVNSGRPLRLGTAPAAATQSRPATRAGGSRSMGVCCRSRVTR